MDGRIDAWGRVAINADEAFRLAYQGIDIWGMDVEPSKEVDRYNGLVDRFDKPNYNLRSPNPHVNSSLEEHAERATNWLISDDIKAIDVRTFLLELCHSDVERDRINVEMDIFEERKLVPLLQLMMYLVDHFRRNNILWGVGRGSSVASYVLFRIGVHRIDSIKYDLPISDFLK